MASEAFGSVTGRATFETASSPDSFDVGIFVPVLALVQRFKTMIQYVVRFLILYFLRYQFTSNNDIASYYL